MSLVLDCSVALAWCFTDEVTPAILAVQSRIAQSSAVVPALWHLEVANGLLIGERRQRLSREDRGRNLALLWSLNLDVDAHTHEQAFNASLMLADAHRLTVYDAAYLELAARRGLPLATLDTQLREAAKAVGVGLVIE